MRQWKRSLIAATGAMALTVLLAGGAWAAEDRTKISSITLTLGSSIEAGSEDGDVTASVDSDKYEVTETNVTNDDGVWSAGDTPRVEVTLEAEDDYYFGAMSSSSVKLKGIDADYVSSKRSDHNSTLVVTIKLEALEGEYSLEEVDWLEEDSPVASWEDPENVDKYQVRLYRNGNSAGSTVSTTSTSYNFASLITRTGDYTFKVRSYQSGSKHGEWYESSEMEVDDDLLNMIRSGNYATDGTPASGAVSGSPNVGPIVVEGWQLDNVGWWYRFADGTYPRNGWLQVNNVWYCFDAVGYMRTGWIQAQDGYYYYCDASSGAMLTNVWTPDNYYVDANGRWIPGAVR